MEKEHKLNREFEWQDHKYRMKIIVYTNQYQVYDVCRWDEEKQEWEYRDARDDWTGAMLLDGFGMLIDFLKLSKEISDE